MLSYAFQQTELSAHHGSDARQENTRNLRVKACVLHALPHFAMSLLPATPLSDGIVTLRPWTDADIPWLVECMKDPEIPRWTRISADFDEAKAKAMVTRMTDFTQRLWLAVIEVGTGRPLGSVGIHRCNVPPPYESVHIAFLLNNSYQGTSFTGCAPALTHSLT